MTPRVTGIWRYPVKSMLGEPLSECEIGPTGIAGDRAFAVIDADDGTVASAKNPRKWAALLGCRASLVDGSVAEITLPDGSTVRTGDTKVDDAVSAVCGRAVHVSSTPPGGGTFEEVWPDIEGLAPAELIATTNVGTSEDGERISRLPRGLMAPGTLFDLSVLHVLTTATLAHLQELAPSATFDVRRYRPNLLLGTEGETGFVENGWVGRTLQAGDAAQISVTIPTMRCVMTTLAQDDLPRDRETLRTIAASNRLEITNLGTWACAGVYADVAAPGTVRIGDAVSVA